MMFDGSRKDGWIENGWTSRVGKSKENFDVFVVKDFLRKPQSQTFRDEKFCIASLLCSRQSDLKIKAHQICWNSFRRPSFPCFSQSRISVWVWHKKLTKIYRKTMETNKHLRCIHFIKSEVKGFDGNSYVRCNVQHINYRTIRPFRVHIEYLITPRTMLQGKSLRID